MSRTPVGETIRIKPANNVFTWMAGATVLFQIVALVLIFLKLRAES